MVKDVKVVAPKLAVSGGALLLVGAWGLTAKLRRGAAERGGVHGSAFARAALGHCADSGACTERSGQGLPRGQAAPPLLPPPRSAATEGGGLPSGRPPQPLAPYLIAGHSGQLEAFSPIFFSECP